MDKDTLIESVRYRCWQRGETYEEFVEQFSSEKDLMRAAAAEGMEGELGRALLEFKLALNRVCLVAELIPER